MQSMDEIDNLENQKCYLNEDDEEDFDFNMVKKKKNVVLKFNLS